MGLYRKYWTVVRDKLGGSLLMGQVGDSSNDVRSREITAEEKRL